jgi:hypothetical protein
MPTGWQALIISGRGTANNQSFFSMLLKSPREIGLFHEKKEFWNLPFGGGLLDANEVSKRLPEKIDWARE